MLGGGLGYGVFRASDAPLSGTALKVGDVLVAIDGRDPKAWVDDVWPRVAGAYPNDPLAVWAGNGGEHGAERRQTGEQGGDAQRQAAGATMRPLRETPPSRK